MRIGLFSDTHANLEALQAVLGNAPDFLEYQIRRLRASAKSDSMVERVRMAEQVAAAISIFTGVAQRITAVNKVANLLEISGEQLSAMVNRAAKEAKGGQTAGGAPVTRQFTLIATGNWGGKKKAT